MRHSKNDYSKEEDFALWQLHEIRRKMNIENMAIEEIREKADKIIKKYGLGLPVEEIEELPVSS